jgi:hypothetical protein
MFNGSIFDPGGVSSGNVRICFSSSDAFSTTDAYRLTQMGDGWVGRCLDCWIVGAASIVRGELATGFNTEDTESTEFTEADADGIDLLSPMRGEDFAAPAFPWAVFIIVVYCRCVFVPALVTASSTSA